MRTVRAEPGASTLIESMRDIVYSLESALADVVDNSITARARTINVFADSTGTEPRIAILDDGDGMTEEELLSAMRLGSRISSWGQLSPSGCDAWPNYGGRS